MNIAKNNTQLPQLSVSVSVTDVRYGNLINHVSFGTVPIRGIAIDGLKTEYKDSFYWDDVKYRMVLWDARLCTKLISAGSL